MGRTTILWFLLLPLSVLSVSSIRILNTTDDLDNNVQFGRLFPHHGLRLMYYLIQYFQFNLNFIDLRDIDPSEGSFGFHRYNNTEGLLPPGHYYTCGNLNYRFHPGSSQLPYYITWAFDNTNAPHRNEDRIIVQCENNNPRRVSRVYATRHYNPDYTWEFSPYLLRQIHNFPTHRDFLILVGAFFMAVYQKQNICYKPRSLPECDTSEVLRLDVQPSSTAEARITWSGIPKCILTSDLVLKVYANMDSSKALDCYSVGQLQSGSRDTNVRLHPGLQVRLEEVKGYWWSVSYTQIWASPEFDEGNRKFPAKVFGYNASLQLFVKQGKACVRLYIKRSFTDWKNTFKHSWVGFYKSSNEENSSYKTWQWAIKFKENQNRYSDEYLAYEYESGLDIHHDFQARFFLQSASSSVKAHTQPWANEVIKKTTDVVGYGASLQLFAKKGKACARLYIEKSFTDWRDKFYHSWVGFYKHTDDGHRSYEDYNWVIYLKENPEEHTDTALAYEYESGCDIRHGVHIRLFLRGYTSLLAQTVPWGKEAIQEEL